MARGSSLQNRKQYHDNQMKALAAADLATQAPRLGLTLDQSGRVPVTFLGRDYLVSGDDIVPVDGRPAGLDHQSVIAHYLMSSGKGELTGDFVPIGRLTGIAASSGSPSDHLIEPLTKEFGYRYDLFKSAALKIGGQHEGQAPSGAEAWLFRPLPKLPVKVSFFEADDEFPAEVRVLFDTSARNLVAYECLELMEIVLVIELLSAANLLDHAPCEHHGNHESCLHHGNPEACDHHKED